jgi:hypothetical protein
MSLRNSHKIAQHVTSFLSFLPCRSGMVSSTLKRVKRSERDEVTLCDVRELQEARHAGAPLRHPKRYVHVIDGKNSRTDISSACFPVLLPANFAPSRRDV